MNAIAGTMLLLKGLSFLFDFLSFFLSTTQRAGCLQNVMLPALGASTLEISNLLAAALQHPLPTSAIIVIGLWFWHNQMWHNNVPNGYDGVTG